MFGRKRIHQLECENASQRTLLKEAKAIIEDLMAEKVPVIPVGPVQYTLSTQAQNNARKRLTDKDIEELAKRIDANLSIPEKGETQ